VEVDVKHKSDPLFMGSSGTWGPGLLAEPQESSDFSADV